MQEDADEEEDEAQVVEVEVVVEDDLPGMRDHQPRLSRLVLYYMTVNQS